MTGRKGGTVGPLLRASAGEEPLKLRRVKLPAFIQRTRASNPQGPSTFASTVVDDAVREEAGADLVLDDSAPTDGRPIEQLPTIGHIGRYALKYRLGEGGLGTVYGALDPLLSREIAVKMLHVDVPAQHRKALEASFLQEARAAAGLNHPHIVTVHDAGASEQGLYIAMERLKGADLRQLLQRGWRPEPVQAATIVRRVADALAYAHDKGVVHCDVKPANIFMVGRTSPKVLDFGIARVGHAPGGQPHSAFAAGSPYYMAPEQLNGGPVDRRSDVYALGAVLYELLSGRKPFSGGTLDDIVDAALHREPVPLGELNRKLPPGLVAIVHRALNKDPAQRFRSARRLSQALRLWSAEQPAPRRFALPFGLGWHHGAMAAVLAGAIGVAAAWWPALQHADSPPVVEAGSALPASAEPASAAATALAAASAAVPEAQPAPAAASEAASAPDDAAAAALALAAAASAPSQRPAAAPREPKPREARKTTATVPPAATGLLHIAVSPWGEVEVDGRPAGTTPPLNKLALPEGTHSVTIRNADFPPLQATVKISAGEPAVLKHRFGS